MLPAMGLRGEEPLEGVLALERVEAQARVDRRAKAAMLLPAQGVVMAQAYLQEVANQALEGGHLFLWISSLVADPMDSPHPKGGETTLEPYLTLKLTTPHSNASISHQTSEAQPFNTRKVAPAS